MLPVLRGEATDETSSKKRDAPPGGVEPPTFRLTAERANHCATEADDKAPPLHSSKCLLPTSMPCFDPLERAGDKIASAGNRTRAARVAGEHSTTEPPMLMRLCGSGGGLLLIAL